MTFVMIGFAGSRRGLTDGQRWLVRQVFGSFDAFELHHGDCVGADAEAHAIAEELGCRHIHLHPPVEEKLRAHCEARQDPDWMMWVHDPLPYLKRNRAIVDAAELVVVCPAQSFEVLRSGTWATYRYAVRRKKPTVLITPATLRNWQEVAAW